MGKIKEESLEVEELGELGIYADDAAMNVPSIDMDMMEAESSNAAASAPAGQEDVTRGLLTAARRFVDQGNPSQALQAVISIRLSSISLHRLS